MSAQPKKFRNGSGIDGVKLCQKNPKMVQGNIWALQRNIHRAESEWDVGVLHKTIFMEPVYNSHGL